MKSVYGIFLCAALALTGAAAARAQNPGEGGKFRMPAEGNYLRYRVEKGDTVYVASIEPAVKYAKGKGRDWRKEARLLHNFGKTYPYALEARRLLAEVNSTIEEDNLVRRKREKYINAIQKDLLDRYEPVLRNMTVTQGKLLIKLIGRETGLTPYEIIHDYKSGMAAGAWQGVARLFGGDLKKTYEPEGEDRAVEDLVKMWESGQYPFMYMSVFGKPPQLPVIDSSPRKDTGGRGRKRQSPSSNRRSSSPSNTR